MRVDWFMSDSHVMDLQAIDTNDDKLVGLPRNRFLA